MRFIPTRIHAVADYLTGVILIAAPWLFVFPETRTLSWIPVGVGIMILVMAFFTDFEYGAARYLPMRLHLNIDVFTGLFLAVSPWLFAFSDQVFLPHLVFGLLITTFALLTLKTPANYGEVK